MSHTSPATKHVFKFFRTGGLDPRGLRDTLRPAPEAAPMTTPAASDSEFTPEDLRNIWRILSPDERLEGFRLLLHDDATREYAYGPAQGLPATGIGTFTQKLYDEAGKRGWTVVSMKKDWKRIFAFEP